MIVLDERTQVTQAIKRWVAMYGLDQTYEADKRGRRVGAELMALDQETSTAAEVAEKLYQPIVHTIARTIIKKVPANIELDDLVQVGMIGAYNALQRYDSNGEASVKTYLEHRIKGAMLDELRSYDWVSRDDRKAQRALEKLRSKLTNKLGRPPLSTELAAEANLSIIEFFKLKGKLSRLMFNVSELRHYDGDDSEDGDSEDENFFLHPDLATPERIYAAKQEAINVFNAASRILKGREAEAFKLVCEDDMTYIEIAKRFGVTESRVCQIIRDVKLKLQPFVSFDLLNEPAAPKVKKTSRRPITAVLDKHREQEAAAAAASVEDVKKRLEADIGQLPLTERWG